MCGIFVAFSKKGTELSEKRCISASKEISKVKVLNLYKSISGKKIIPFYTKDFEGFDINHQYDLKYANFLIKKNKIKIKK
jgi:hypothetical protein